MAVGMKGCFTNGVLGWEVDGISVQVFQECAIHQIRELMDLYGLFIGLVQQCSEMLTPINTTTKCLFLINAIYF